MHEVEQAQLLNIQGRFLRSTHIERDWHDPAALQDYVVTQHAKQSMARLAAGLTPTSGLRAWRITGDYGSGKSSFALLLANLLSDRRQQLPTALQVPIAPALQSVDAASLPLWPVLVTGSREPLGLAIVRCLHELLLALPEPPAKLVAKLHAAVAKGLVSDAQVIKWVQAVHTLVLESRLAQGLLLVLDEVGKFLEFAALHPERQDIYLLQGLAELAARSGPAPLMIVVLMHQGISGYAENLTQTQQREWEKIAGRYEELSWHHPLEQVAELISSALNTDLTEAPRQAPARAKRDMQDALRLRWYGTASHQKSLLDIAARLYPLHPSVLPVLVRLFATFGQNERSLFSFLLGSEPFGLLDFVERTEGRDFFRIADLYDYARQAFNQRLSLQSFRNHWKAIEGIVSSYRGEDPLELGLLKTIGLLNVLNAEDLLATNEALELALRGSEDVKAAIQRLKAQHLLYYRGAAGGYSLWPHTSVNLDTVYSEATREVGSLQKVAGLVRDRLEVRPLVARRHYIRTGTLRFFEVVYVAVDTLADHVQAPLTADGRILVPLCETPEEEARALALAQTEITQAMAQVLIAVPQPLQGLAPVLAEVLRWEWIQRNVPELQHDGPARDETATQLALAQQRLAEHLQRYVGMTNATAESGLRWFRQGALLPTVKSGPEIMTLLTTVLDEVFHSAPLIHNELVNRKSPSSAAAAARGRLCEHLFETSSEPYLGMDATKTPPEMSMYLSVLKEAQLHVFDAEQQTWSLQLPAPEHDPLRVIPAFQRIGEVLRESSDARVPATEVYAALQQAPYGVREGLIPLLLAIFSVINEQELAYYEDDTFIPRITGSNFFRLTKAPETFDIQFYPISGVRTGLFQSLIQHLKLSGKQPVRVDLLDVVKPLLTFVAGLPTYTLKTSRLAPQTKAVRALLMTARDPAMLLFHSLPQACDLPPILEGSVEQDQQVEQFALALKTAIDELRGAHPALLHWIKERLQEEFLLHGTFEQVRQALAPRAASVAGFVTEPRLKSFCLRLADTNLSETMWLESLGNLVCAMPPAKWKDADVHKYEQEIHHLAAQFARVEAIVYNRSKFKGTVEGESVRIALTQPTGQERKKVIHLTPEEVKDANELQDVIAGLLRDKGLVGMAAASRALWQLLSTTEPTATEPE